jgi:hypothetical protein
MLKYIDLHALLVESGLIVENRAAWINQSEFDDRMKIVTAPEHIGSLSTAVTVLARSAIRGGINLPLAAGRLRFEDAAGRTVARQP